jgi:hypothetical protein
MAKTSKRGKRRIGRQGALEALTPQDMLDAISRPSPEEKQKLLREGGFIDANGKLAQRYRSWGKRVSRTEVPSRV